MENRNGRKKRSNGTGFYIALCCCVTVLGIVGYINNRPSPDSSYEISSTEPVDEEKEIISVTPTPTQKSVITPSPLPTFVPEINSQINSPESAPVSSLDEDEPVHEASAAIATEPDVIESGENSEFYTGETVESVSLIEQPTFSAPLSGEVLDGFEDKKLIYNDGFGDWRTHNGIDIAAKENDIVCASCSGEIMDIYDSAYGKTVIMTHDNDFKTVYSNLADTDSLKVGQKINKGEKIALLGKGKTGERTEENHLHFELIHGDTPVNPEEYIEF